MRTNPPHAGLTLTRVLHYDCFCGISGDMHIGAMLDLGVPAELLRDRLGQLPNQDEFKLETVRDQRKGISGTRASVLIDPNAPKPHRHLRHIVEIIQSARFESGVEALALNIFNLIAEAEAAVHDIAVEAVHFHEVGATDAIVDIVAAAVCIDHLAPERVYCGPIEVGSGTVRCDHGLMPVPAPATAALLRGLPCHHGRVTGEATTPTGAAILKAVVTDFTVPETLTTEQWGYGVGQKDFEVANILRVGLGTQESSVASQPNQHYQRERNVELQCNIDDMSPEATAPLLEALWNAGALEVNTIATSMKKQRPGITLTVLLQPGDLDAILATVFAHSSTIGVRTHEVRKWMLPRAQHQVATSLGAIRVKVATQANGEQRFKLEHDDVRACCGPAMSYLDTRAQLEREVQSWLDQQRTQDGANSSP